MTLWYTLPRNVRRLRGVWNQRFVKITKENDLKRRLSLGLGWGTSLGRGHGGEETYVRTNNTDNLGVCGGCPGERLLRLVGSEVEESCL